MRVLNVFLAALLVFLPPTPYAAAGQDALSLPAPGTMLDSSRAFMPPIVRGMTLDLNNPLSMRFIIDSGDSAFSQEAVSGDIERQVRYFLAALTVAEDDLWVNLSPYEQERMIADTLGQTDLGRDMLAQDYVLKQLSASLIHPEKELGKVFWARVYALAQEKLGTTDIPLDIYHKVWIMPDEVSVWEEGASVYVTQATLKVLVEEDYLALTRDRLIDGAARAPAETSSEARQMTTRIMKDVIIPELIREVNEGENFAPLRQVFHALILAKWYKETVQNALFNDLYIEKNKILGVDLKDKSESKHIYSRYVEAYRKGAFNFIKEEIDENAGDVLPKKYFSGGLKFGREIHPKKDLLNRPTARGQVLVADLKLKKAEPAMMAESFSYLALSGALPKIADLPLDKSLLVVGIISAGLGIAAILRYKVIPEIIRQKIEPGIMHRIHLPGDPQDRIKAFKQLKRIVTKERFKEVLLIFLGDSDEIIRDEVRLMLGEIGFSFKDWILNEIVPRMNVFSEHERFKAESELIRMGATPKEVWGAHLSAIHRMVPPESNITPETPIDFTILNEHADAMEIALTGVYDSTRSAGAMEATQWQAVLAYKKLLSKNHPGLREFAKQRLDNIAEDQSRYKTMNKNIVLTDPSVTARRDAWGNLDSETQRELITEIKRRVIEDVTPHIYADIRFIDPQTPTEKEYYKRHILKVMKESFHMKDYSILNAYVQAMVFLKVPGFEVGMTRQAIYTRVADALQKHDTNLIFSAAASPRDGGIDARDIQMTREGKGLKIALDPKTSENFISGQFWGFLPVVTQITEVPDLGNLLGKK